MDSVTQLMTVAEQLAVTVARTHCQPPICISRLKDQIHHSATHSTQVIQNALSTDLKQQQLIDEIRDFAMIYTKIALRDHRLFFEHFRNVRIFETTSALKNTRIPHPLADARRVSILIVGGGIGGMATALSFAQAGVRVRLLERNVEFGEVGAGMQLAPNCSRLLDQLGILKQVQLNAVFPKQIVWMDALSGERLAAIDLGKQFLETFGYPYIVVHRADLFQALYQGVCSQFHDHYGNQSTRDQCGRETEVNYGRMCRWNAVWLWSGHCCWRPLVIIEKVCLWRWTTD